MPNRTLQGMQPNELNELMTDLFGQRWQAQVARLLDKDVTTINRWARGRALIPRWIDVLVWSLTMNKRHGIIIPAEFTGAPETALEAKVVEPDPTP